MSAINTIIFDLGGVLIDWNPRYVFDDNYFESEEKRAYFFNHICTNDWNEEQDAGRSIVTATQELVEKFPEWETAIRDYYGRWTDMLKSSIPDTVEIFRALRQNDRFKIYALTNWQAGLFDIALVRYDFLHWFDGRVVSGEEKTRKPFPEFYHRLLNRYEVDPAKAVFIDDNLRNVKAAQDLGIDSIHFQSPAQLQQELQQRKLI
ncbi:MAG: HAD family phosphatase [Sphingobacteriales bacterium]|jgi:2-haloacid dehalogenase|nr:HAD family phosphatase [Sphingobacteriales bacterium]NCT75044.1 HAD family phosphatase [Chitinophagaceae bacterium]OJW31934.1 MAG: HAD family hydrolase [Sphingobacteriales bacterium 46-32]